MEDWIIRKKKKKRIRENQRTSCTFPAMSRKESALLIRLEYFSCPPNGGYWFSSVQFSHSIVSDSLWPHELQHARSPCPSPTPGGHQNPCPSSQWCHPTISSSVIPSPPALNLSQHQGLLKWVSSSHQVAQVLEFKLQHQSYQWTPRTDLL